MRYHFVITIQFRASRGEHARYWTSGTAEAEPGITRQELFDQIYEDARVRGAAKLLASDIETHSPVVLFFSLEPDELPG